MGGFEVLIQVGVEPSVKYHSLKFYILTHAKSKKVKRMGTVSGGQFVWGTFLPKSNGGVY